MTKKLNKIEKAVWLALLVVLPGLSGAYTFAGPEKVTIPTVTAKTIRQDVAQASCAQAVIRTAKPPMTAEVTKVVPIPAKQDDFFECSVDARLIEKLDHSGSAYRTTQAQFAVKVDVKSGDSTVSQVDTIAAKQAISEALSSLFIDLKPVKITERQVEYVAMVDSRKRCAITARLEGATGQEKTWRISSIQCEAKKSPQRKSNWEIPKGPLMRMKLFGAA